MALESRNGMYVEVIANGDTIALTQDLMLQTEHGSGAISINVGTASSYAMGLRFVIDNSLGIGDVNMNSSAFIIPAGATYQYTVVPDGAGKKYVQRIPVWLGLGTEDEIQLALNNAKVTGKDIELAGTDIFVTETLTTPFATGNGIRGKGAMDAINPNNNLRGLGSSLVWQGDRSTETADTTVWDGAVVNEEVPRPLGTLLHYRGREMSLEQFAFHGARHAEISPSPIAKCPVGLLINTSGAGLGTGKLHVRKVVFDYFDTAIQVATLLGEGNCDTSAWYDVTFNRCNTGMKTINAQGLSHTFYNLRVGLTDVVFDYLAGGDLTCFRTFIGNTTTLLKFNNDTPAGFGLNGIKYHFYGMKIDSQVHTSKLVYMEAGTYYADIVFDGLHVGYGGVTTDYMFNIANHTTLQVRNAKNIREGMFRWNTTTAKSLIVVETSRLYGNVTDPAMLFDVANSTGACRCIVRNCILDGTNTILNYDAVLTG